MAKHKIPETSWVLPEHVYEAGRYLSWIVLPAVATAWSIMNAAWSWNCPMEPILTTFGAVETLLGTLLGFSKSNNDKNVQAATIAEVKDGKCGA